MTKIPVKIKLFDPTLPHPRYHSTLAAGFDLYNRLACTLPPQAVTIVPTNIALEIPPAYWLMVVARSSLHKSGLLLINSVGVIDADYCGDDDEIGLLLYNYTTKKINLPQGTRLAQGVIQKRYQANFEVVEHLGNDNRGGLGSTGKF